MTDKQELPSNASLNADGTISITLQYPIMLAGVLTNVLTARRPKVRDRMNTERGNANKTAAEKELALFAAITSLAPSELEDLDIADYSTLSQVFTSFFASVAPAT